MIVLFTTKHVWGHVLVVALTKNSSTRVPPRTHHPLRAQHQAPLQTHNDRGCVGMTLIWLSPWPIQKKPISIRDFPYILYVVASTNASILEPDASLAHLTMLKHHYVIPLWWKLVRQSFCSGDMAPLGL